MATYSYYYAAPDYGSVTTGIWLGWIGAANATMAAATVVASPWANWTTGSLTTAATWGYWNDAVGQTVDLIRTTLAERTPEQVQADADRARVAQAQREERLARERADREQAVQRAETLLHAHLTTRQRRSLRERNRFRVRGQSGRWYEIVRGHHANTFGLDSKGRRVESLCVYATGGVPEADCMLAQALHLEVNEEHLRRVAHITPVGFDAVAA